MKKSYPYNSDYADAYGCAINWYLKKSGLPYDTTAYGFQIFNGNSDSSVILDDNGIHVDGDEKLHDIVKKAIAEVEEDKYM